MSRRAVVRQLLGSSHWTQPRHSAASWAASCPATAAWKSLPAGNRAASTRKDVKAAPVYASSDPCSSCSQSTSKRRHAYASPSTSILLHSPSRIARNLSQKASYSSSSTLQTRSLRTSSIPRQQKTSSREPDRPPLHTSTSSNAATPSKSPTNASSTKFPTTSTPIQTQSIVPPKPSDVSLGEVRRLFTLARPERRTLAIALGLVWCQLILPKPL